MVRHLLDDLAGAVPDYTDPDRALAAARAARRRRAGGGMALTAAALALVATVNLASFGGAGPDPQPTPHRTAATQPTGLTLPPLPDVAVGAARLLYRLNCALPCSREVVMLADGTRYAFEPAGGPGVPSLSPDGRLLVAPFDQLTYAVRDLGGAGPSHLFDQPLEPSKWDPMTWSPDNRWLVMWYPQGNGISNYARVDLSDYTVVKYQPPPDVHAIAVLPSGELLLAPLTWSAEQPLTLVDPATGASRALATVDTRPWMSSGQLIWHDATSPAMVSPDGNRLGVVVRSPGNRAAALLEIRLATGELLGWHDLPRDAGWTPVAYTEGGLFAVRKGPTRAGVFSLANDSVTEITGLPEVMAVLVPGGHTWYGA